MRIERDDYIIQGVPWRVCFDRTTSELSLEDAYARTNYDTRTITIAAGLCFEETIESLVHETLHILAHGFESLDLVKEDVVRIVSLSLTDTILRNQLSFIPDGDGGW